MKNITIDCKDEINIMERINNKKVVDADLDTKINFNKQNWKNTKIESISASYS